MIFRRTKNKRPAYKEQTPNISIGFSNIKNESIGSIITSLAWIDGGDTLTLTGCNEVIFDGKICALVPMDREKT